VAETGLPAGVTLGEAIRVAREEHGLSVDDVSARTRIRSTVIRDLESDRIASSGGSVYARGHVKSICSAIGIDPAQYLDLFARQLGGEQPPAVQLQAQPKVPEPRFAAGEPLHVPTAARPERRGPNWVAAGSVALAVLVALFVIGQISKPGGESPVDAGGSLAPSTAPSVAPPKTQGPTKNLTAAVPVPTGANLRVRLIGGDSWVSVRNGTRTLFEGVLRNGMVKDFRDAKSLRLIVGNAGAVNLVCSGRDLGPAGGQGKVRRFTCNAEGIVPA
jgi:hypothetical protein